MKRKLYENPTIERPQLMNVYNFAKAKHDETGAVRRHSGKPYWEHPSMVADICLAYGGTDQEVALALLHDTKEDTNVTYEEIASMYGRDVAELLSEITNDPQEVQRLGKEEYINQELVEIEHPALFVKLCDMYANTLDYPSESQLARMQRNIEHLIEFRGDDLTKKERRLLKSFPFALELDLDKSEFERNFDDETFQGYKLFEDEEIVDNESTEEEFTDDENIEEEITKKLQDFLKDWNKYVDEADDVLTVPDLLQEARFEYEPLIISEDGVVRIAETCAELIGSGEDAYYSPVVVVSLGFLELKPENQKAVLLHELAHAEFVMGYALDKDFDGLHDYYMDNGGHNSDWKKLVTGLEDIFNVSIPEKMNLRDGSLYVTGRSMFNDLEEEFQLGN